MPGTIVLYDALALATFALVLGGYDTGSARAGTASPNVAGKKVNDTEVASGVVPVSAPLLFTANDCLDVGTDLGSAVSVDYFDAVPFKFNGRLEQALV